MTIPPSAFLLSFILTMTTARGQNGPDDCADLLVPILNEHQVPALGAVAVVDGEIRMIGVTGVRKAGDREPVTVDDRWHIGSCTKSMTATLAAIFVEEGKLSWSTTVGEILGREIKMLEAYEAVTLHQLVSNRSGIPGSAPAPIWREAWEGTGKSRLKDRRRDYVEAMLGIAPEFEPGSNYAYSNTGYVVAGAMLEAITGESWESLITARLFEPLEMDSAGFGSAAKPGKVDQPWGHHSSKKPQEPGLQADNPDVLGPAGTVHVSLKDLARYVAMHADREVGPVLSKKETFDFLHAVAPGNEDYACGWIRVKRGWAGGDALTHAGSNTMNYCVIWIAPERGFGGIAVTNSGQDEATKACDSAVSGLIENCLE